MTNPLQQFFRAVKLYTKLPSGTAYYNDVDFNEDGEIGVMAMTAKDEMSARNPDALLNGEAIVEIINSCVPGVKNPRKLLANDIDALMIAIRHATYGDDLEVTSECPKCKHANTFGVNISQSLASMTFLEPEYTIDLSNGVTIYVKPFGYDETIKALKAQFEQMKISRNLENSSASEEDKLKVFSKSFNTLSDLNIELLTACVSKVVINQTQEVTEQDHISEFLQNIDKPTFTQLDNIIKDINTVGIKKNFNAKCEKCEHEWDAAIDFNPVNFFMES